MTTAELLLLDFDIEIANTALFLASELSSAITGEVMFVDCGFNITGI